MTTQAERIVIRSLSDDELRVESKRMWKLSSYAQGMATKMEQELARRRKALRRAAQEANRGE